MLVSTHGIGLDGSSVMTFFKQKETKGRKIFWDFGAWKIQQKITKTTKAGSNAGPFVTFVTFRLKRISPNKKPM